VLREDVGVAEPPQRHVYSIGMRTPFRGITRRTGMLLAGPAGWGEFAPFADYDAVSAAAWLAAAHEAATLGWPPAVRDRIPVNVTVPACSPQRAAEIVAAAGGAGTVKVKVAEPGQSLADDLERVAAVRDVLGPTRRIRVDANGAWPDPESAARAIRALDREVGLEYVEQPCRTVPELARVRRLVDVPIAADESIRRADDPLEVVRAEAADIAVIKVAPLGVVRAALRLVESLGLPVVVSSALETSVGIAAGVALAAALPELPYACGLGTVALLEADVVSEPLLPVDGWLTVRQVVPDPVRLAALAADAEVADGWERRLAEVEAALRRLGGGAGSALRGPASGSGSALREPGSGRGSALRGPRSGSGSALRGPDAPAGPGQAG
jgi:O-succinylbenzoate synthase